MDIQGFDDLAPDELLNAIESVGAGCNGVFIPLNSYENRVYRVDLVEPLQLAVSVQDGEVESVVGADPRRVVAKFYRPGRWSDEQILEEHQFACELAEHDLPVVAPLTLGAGSTLFHYHNFRFALYPCVGGRAPELDNPEQLEQIGRLIGRIHAVGADGHFRYRDQLTVERWGREARASVQASKLLPDYLREAYASVTDILLALVSEQWRSCEPAAVQRLHGDLHPGNLLWNDHGPWLVDLDDAITGPAIQDIWMFLSGDRDYMSARLGDLLVGYEQFNRFDSRQLALIEPLRTLRMIPVIASSRSTSQGPWSFQSRFPGCRSPCSRCTAAGSQLRHCSDTAANRISVTLA